RSGAKPNGVMVDVASTAENDALREFGFAPLRAPRPNLVVELLRWVYVVEIEGAFGVTAANTRLALERLRTPLRHPPALVVPLGFGVAVRHARLRTVCGPLTEWLGSGLQSR